MKTLTYLPVNWVNGLKLTSQHFFANQYCQTEALNREAGRSLTSYNYGLGEVLEGIGDNLEIEISGDTMSTLCVRLKSCNAITKGGLPIVYYDGLYGDEKPCATISESGLQAEDSEYMVLISVDPYHLIPVGEPDPEEVPLHHPYVLPSIKLHIVPKNQVNKSFYSQNFLLVAEVCRQGNTYKINHQYIPPVQHSACHDGIKTFISQLARTLQSIKEDVKLIYSTKPSGSAPLRPHRYFNPLIPSTKNVLRSNVPSILYSLCTNKFSPAYVPTVPYAPLR